MGHSLGRATVVSLGRIREDIDAVVDLDGTMLGEIFYVENGVDVVNIEPYTVPLFSIDNMEHHDERIAIKDNGGVYTNNVVYENAEVSYNTYIRNSGYMNFTNLRKMLNLIAIEGIMIMIGMTGSMGLSENPLLVVSFVASVFIVYVLVLVISWLLDLGKARQMNINLENYQRRVSD